MVCLDDVRDLVLDFPEVAEMPHHEISSFRFRNKIFATIPDDQHFHIMLTTEYIDMAMNIMPEACEKLSWGKRLVGVRVSLIHANMDDLEEILRVAYECKSRPRRTKGTRGRNK